MVLSHYIWDFVIWPENESRGDLYGWPFAEKVCWPLPAVPVSLSHPNFSPPSLLASLVAQW